MRNCDFYFKRASEQFRTLNLFVPERTQENENNNVLIYESCTVDENVYNGFQTVPSTTSILSW